MEDDVKRAFDTARLESIALHEETRRYFDTVAERLENKIEIVAEGLQHVDQRVGRTEMRLDRLETKVDALDTKVDELDRKVNALDTKVDGIDRKLDAALEDLRPRVARLEKPN